jgi:hypothetical protein
VLIENISNADGISGNDNNTFDIGGFSLVQAQPAPDEKLDFTVQIADADGDTTSASFSIGIDGTGTFDNNHVDGVNPGSPLTAASLGDGVGTEALTEQGLQRILAEAMEHWYAASLAPQQLSALGQVTFHLTDLPGALLGWASGREIWIDVDAAGWGWSFGAAPGRMDLAHAVEHELGHVLRFGHSDEGVMEATLSSGTRLVPAPGPLAAALASNLQVEAPAATLGLTTRPSAVTVLDQATALASRSPSVITVGNPSTETTNVAAVLAPSLGVVATPSTQGADLATAIVGARAGIASTASFVFLSSVRTDSGALASSPGVAIPTSHQDIAERLAPHAGRPAPTAPAFGWLFSDAGVTFFDEANDPLAEKVSAPPQRVIDRLFGGDETPLSEEAIDHLFGGDVAPHVGGTLEPGSAGISAAMALVGMGYLLGHRRGDRNGKSRLEWMRA